MYEIDLEKAVDLHVESTTSAADVLKELMEYNHVTQEEFAKHVRLSQKQLSFILNRKAYMSIAVAKRIGQATGLNAKWLIQLDLNYQFDHLEEENSQPVEKFAWAIG
jgi:plasmid maintenance system antidote protein VapI